MLDCLQLFIPAPSSLIHPTAPSDAYIFLCPAACGTQVINEPEWCIQGLAGAGVAVADAVAASDMQRFVGMVAESG